jgi:hypothetical protein
MACTQIPKLKTAECTVVKRSTEDSKQQAERVFVQLVYVIDRLESAEFGCAALWALGISAKCAKELPALIHPSFAVGAFERCDGV